MSSSDFRQAAFDFFKFQIDNIPSGTSTLNGAILRDQEATARRLLNNTVWNNLRPKILQVEQWISANNATLGPPWLSARQNPIRPIMSDIMQTINVWGVAGAGLYSHGLFGGRTHNNYVLIFKPVLNAIFNGPPSTPTPPPTEQSILIDGVQVFPSQFYDATITDISRNVITSSGRFRGSDLIALFKTGTVRIQIGTIIPVPTPIVTPVNPFVRLPDGTQIFLNETVKVEVL